MTAVARMPTHVKELSRVSKDEWREFTKSVWSIPNTTSRLHPAVFPVEIPRRLIRLFSFHGEIVLDPFCGIGTTGIAALTTGRRFFGQDLSGSYVRHARSALVSEARRKGDVDGWEVRRGDSRKLPLRDMTVDLTVTSPPYWDKADYGKHKGNLGNVPDYSAFIESIRPFFAEVYRVLRPGRRFCVVTANVNQHTTEGLLTYPLAADFINVARDVGFLVVNQIVWSKDGTGGRWGSSNGQRPIFGSYPYPPNFLFKNVHEFVLIFRRPSSSERERPLRLIKRDARPSSSAPGRRVPPKSRA